MKKVIRLTESDLVKIVKRVLNEQVPMSNVRDNTNVVPHRIKSPSETAKYYKESTELTRQGCTQTDYELEDFEIEKGECFSKNNKSLEFLVKKKSGNNNIRLDRRDGFSWDTFLDNSDGFNYDKVLQSIPDAVLLDDNRNRGLYYFCDKNPMDRKSNFIYLHKEKVGSTAYYDYHLKSTIPLKKSAGNYNKTTITLDTPLRKFFCSGR